MAALNQIARDNADELRDGIAWVIVWKTGRSWHAEPVWLSCESDTFEPDDEKRAREILAEDSNAVMLNGYECGHFGEDMTIEELAAGIRWHYANGYNTLDGSTAFSPDPQPEAAQTDEDSALQPRLFIDGKPFSGTLPTISALPDIEAPEAPAESLAHPPDMTLTWTIGPHEADALLRILAEAAQHAIDRLAQAVAASAEALSRQAGKIIKAAAAAAARLWDRVLYTVNDHPKWWHLYKHAKKYRVRKKYRKRLEEQLYKKLGAAPGYREVII